MSKGKSSRKESKKKPVLTAKEKKAAKLAKKQNIAILGVGSKISSPEN